jgi:hypothetical protein
MAEWPQAAARLIEDVAAREVAAVTGGDGSLSNWPSLGDATTKATASTGHASVQAQGRLWRVLQNGTTAHEVAARRARAILTPYGPRKRVNVRGMPGRSTWSRVLAGSNEVVERATLDAFGRLGR